MTDQYAPLSKCDVTDLDALALFRYHRRQWVADISGEDYHSCYSQILHLIENDGVFRLINDARKTSQEHSGTLHMFVDEGFVAVQAMRIRRLTDSGFDDPKKRVVSLMRVIDEIDRFRLQLTRERYICYNGARYDGASKSASDFLVPRMHILFDQLACTDRASRKRGDTPHKDFLKKARATLAKCEPVRAFANKFLAHAASAESRMNVSGPSLDLFRACYTSLADVCQFLSSVILYGSSLSFNVFRLGKRFENFESPICPESHLGQLAILEQSLDQFSRSLGGGSQDLI